MYYYETASPSPAPPEAKPTTAATPLKFCINCKHIGRNGSGDASQYKCFAPVNVMAKSPNLVTGIEVIEFRHDTCYLARLNYDGEFRCGPEGKWFEERPPQPPGFGCPPQHEATKRVAADDLLSQLDKMK